MCKKVLFIIDSLGQGGAQRQVTIVASLLKRHGHDVTVLCYHPQDFFLPKLQSEGIPVKWLIEKRLVQRILKVRHFVRRGGYDVVISFLHTENILNILSSIGVKRWKVVCGERSAKKEYLLTKKGRLLGYLMRKADTLVCNSENARKMWVRHYPHLNEKIKVIYNSVQPNSAKQPYHPYNEGKLHVLIAASYQYLKNPIGMIEGVNLLSQEYKKKLVIDWYGRKEVLPGDTRAFDEAINLIHDYKLESVVHLNKERLDVVELMERVDVVALFSRVEGLPNCICEAMMIGKPVIMSRVSDYNVLVDEKNGVLCDGNEPESIAEAFITMLNKKSSELEDMGSASKRKAYLLFSEEEVTKKWEKLL